jgi:hypothetical protein
MIALTPKTAIRTANQVFDDLGLKHPWSFVAIASGQDNELKLRLIHVDTEFEMAARVSYARPVHAFYAECSRALAGLSKVLREMVARQHDKQILGMGKPVAEVGT